MKKTLLTGSILLCGYVFAQTINVTELGRYTDGRETACEITAYDKEAKKLYVTNAAADSVDIVDVSDLTSPVRIGQIDVQSYGTGVNSVVTLGNGFIAVAIAADVSQDSGKVVFYDTAGTHVADVIVGALPDMVTVTHDGEKVLVACEGEPSDDYLTDPEGCIAIIDISGGVENVTQSDVKFLTFSAAPATITGSVHKPGTTWSQDLEPEYIAISEDDEQAFVTCQEANVMIFVDLDSETITGYKGLGFKDHSVAGYGLDPSNDDGGINIGNWDVKGIYMPDAIYAFTIDGTTYIASANEGDGRDYSGYSSETRIGDETLDTIVFPNYADLQDDAQLGRLKTLTPDVIGDTDNDGDLDELYSYGARSFTIWNSDGTLLWDSGDDFESYIETNYPDFFNCDEGDVGEFDERSDDKGPEPEAITVGKIGNRYYAFIGLERQGGIMYYDVTDPSAPVFEGFVHSFDTANGTMTDIAPEGLLFIHKDESHSDQHLLIARHEFSGTTTIFEIEDLIEGVSENGKSEISINTFPNPTSGKLNIQIDNFNTAGYQFTVTNILGTVVKTGRINASMSSIELGMLSDGVYNISIVSNDQNEFSSMQFVKN